jgi:predicted membrane channel-forming protein YqfA (hemolysin III family)
MNDTTLKLILGTTTMLSIALSIVVIVFISQLMRKTRVDAGKVYKDWVIFTGIALTVTSVFYSIFGEPYLKQLGFMPEQIQLLAIYNSFVKFVGVTFILTWAAILEAFEIGERIYRLAKRKKQNA